MALRNENGQHDGKRGETEDVHGFVLHIPDGTIGNELSAQLVDDGRIHFPRFSRNRAQAIDDFPLVCCPRVFGRQPTLSRRLATLPSCEIVHPAVSWIRLGTVSLREPP